MDRIRRAVISVFDKTGIVEFARSLTKLGVEIISTGGTAKLLSENGIACTEVAKVTAAPEMLDGRVKTLHPAIHAGILAKRDKPEHLQQLESNGIKPIDMIVVNLYPFEQVVQKSDVELAEALENIDIGGPTMVRAAAKNFPWVAVVTSPEQYDTIIVELTQSDGALSFETRKKLAMTAFQLTHRYDGAIAAYLRESDEADAYPDRVVLELEKLQSLRYGENPHQTAAFYRELGSNDRGITELKQLHGKALSFNNIMDLDAVVKMLKTFDEPCAVIVKHSNPCGVAVGQDVFDAYQKALATDPVSAFGGIFGFNRTVDLSTAEELRKIFIEVIIAPDFDAGALKLLSKKKNVRLIKLPLEAGLTAGYDYKRVAGGMLIQSQDVKSVDELELKVVTQRAPSVEEWQGLKFAWKVVKWVKSNAVIFCLKDRTIGIGAGQMSRVDASMLAADKARRSGLSLDGTVVASDAFFPFRDGVDAAADAGATAIIQPGGSIRDQEVIQAADEHNMAMVFTSVRHFRH